MPSMTETVEPPRHSRARSLALSAVKAAVSLGLLYLLFSRVDVSRLWSVARTASPVHHMVVGRVGPGVLWAGFGLGAVVATPALLFPDTVTRLLQPLRVFHQEWVDARLEKLTFALTKFKETPTALAECFAGAVA